MALKTDMKQFSAVIRKIWVYLPVTIMFVNNHAVVTYSLAFWAICHKSGPELQGH